MEICKILTLNDRIWIPEYSRIFNDGLDSVSNLYEGTVIENARRKYTSEFIHDHLVPNDENRFIGHFTGNELDGILIEGFDEMNGIRTSIDWIIADKKGRGIGTRLISDCLARAKNEKKDMVALMVSNKNKRARELYTSLGFKSGGPSQDGTMEVMGYLFKEPVH